MLQLNICTYISVKGLETPVMEVFKRLVNQTSFNPQEQNINRFINNTLHANSLLLHISDHYHCILITYTKLLLLNSYV